MGDKMKLIIKRDQKEQKGIFGGYKGMTFLLSSRVELTPDEQALIAKYKAEDHTLTYTTSSNRRADTQGYGQLLDAGCNRRDG